MRVFTRLFLSTILLTVIISQVARAQFQYVSPKPGSQYHNPETNIILKNGSAIDESSLLHSLVHVTGSASGVHESRIVLSDDAKTIVIYPTTIFTEGEQVNVVIDDGFRKKTGQTITGTAFNFLIHAHRTPGDLESIRSALQYSKEIEFKDAGLLPLNKDGNTRDTCAIPAYTITSTGNEYKGDLFYFNQKASGGGCFARTILTSEGDSIFALSDNERGICFTINHNGYLTYYSLIDSCFEMMDSSYNVIKKFFMGNGYVADEHEFQIYPDGTHFMFCYDVQPNLDMTAVGGIDTVDVTGCVIQELDASGNVIFQWRSWDYFLYTDAIFWVENTLPGATKWDWIHANSMDLDFDGNLLLSSRHLSEITKIDLVTGDIIWRFGGDNNQFTFVDEIDTIQTFSGQHDFRRQANGNYTMFNNGNALSPLVTNTKAKEYSLDQTNKIATLVWYYSHPQVNGINVNTPAMGNVQKLPNGNTFINWGLVSVAFPDIPRFTELDPDDNIVWEFNFSPVDYYIVYRAYKFDWNRCPPPADSTFELTYVGSDSAELTWAVPNFNSSYIFEYKLSSSSTWTSVPVITNVISLNNLQPNSIYDWRVQSICTVVDDSSAYSGIQQFTTLAVGVQGINSGNAAVTVYPNPAHELMNISFHSEKSVPVTVRITNPLGEVIHEEVAGAAPGINLRKVNVSSLVPGVYLVQLTSNEFSALRQVVIH